MERKYLYHVDIDDISPAIFYLLDRLELIKQSNYEGNGWMRMEVDRRDAEIIEELIELDAITVVPDN